MALGDGDYLRATRHPWAAALFVLPLLAVYEVGVFSQGTTAPPEQLRNGADLWLRGMLTALGLSQLYAGPLLLLSVLLLLLGLFFSLLLLLSICRSRDSKNQQQNCRSHDSDRFHICYLV